MSRDIVNAWVSKIRDLLTLCPCTPNWWMSSINMWGAYKVHSGLKEQMIVTNMLFLSTFICKLQRAFLTFSKCPGLCVHYRVCKCTFPQLISIWSLFFLFQINLIRRRTPVLLQTYLPSGLFVFVSWVSFIIPPEVVPGKTQMFYYFSHSRYLIVYGTLFLFLMDSPLSYLSCHLRQHVPISSIFHKPGVQ